MKNENLTAKLLVEKLEKFNKDRKREPLDSKYIEQKIQKRNNRERFEMSDYIEGMVFSMLSSQTEWKKIYLNRENIKKIFNDFNPNFIKKTPAEHFVEKIKEIKCGNLSIRQQMNALNGNIVILEKIEKKFDSVDNYINQNNKSLEDKLKMIDDFAFGEYKLGQLLVPLVSEFLRNVGVDTIKPDRHICRILGKSTLGVLTEDDFNDEEKIDVIRSLENFVKNDNIPPYKFDLLMWDYCAGRGNAICLATNTHTQCVNNCVIKEYCKKGN